jgi:hypothetical protein
VETPISLPDLPFFTSSVTITDLPPPPFYTWTVWVKACDVALPTKTSDRPFNQADKLRISSAIPFPTPQLHVWHGN